MVYTDLCLRTVHVHCRYESNKRWLRLFALPVRSLGSGLATGTNWASNFVVGLTFLPMMALLSPSVTFALYALVCTGTWVAIWRIYPETAGMGLEAVGGLLSEGWGVEESLRRWSARDAVK